MRRISPTAGLLTAFLFPLIGGESDAPEGMVQVTPEALETRPIDHLLDSFGSWIVDVPRGKGEMRIILDGLPNGNRSTTLVSLPEGEPMSRRIVASFIKLPDHDAETGRLLVSCGNGPAEGTAVGISRKVIPVPRGFQIVRMLRGPRDFDENDEIVLAYVLFSDKAPAPSEDGPELPHLEDDEQVIYLKVRVDEKR